MLTVAVVGIWAGSRMLKKGEKIADNVTSVVSGPTAEKEGETWDHKEFLAYLQSKKIAINAHTTHTGSFHGPAAYFAADEKALLEIVQNDGKDGPTTWKGIAYIQKRKSAQDAKDESGVGGDNSFSWGRFIIVSRDLGYLNRIKAALK